MSAPNSPPRGPWSDLPPEPPRAPRPPLMRWRPIRGAREPFINNWRGLLIIAFLLFVAPVLANWLSHVILAHMAAR